jgi:hypothetical protein
MRKSGSTQKAQRGTQKAQSGWEKYLRFLCSSLRFLCSSSAQSIVVPNSSAPKHRD